MIKNILLPLDGSSTSKKAIDTAVELAGQLGATVIVTHIMNQDNDKPYDEVESEANDILNEAVNILVDNGIDTKTMILFGSPEFDIVTVARKSEADMIIMGQTGIGNSSDIIGSFNKATLKHVKLPVMLVK